MSIAAIGLPDTRLGASGGPSAVDRAILRGGNTTLDPSLPPSAQVPEMEELQATVDSFNRFIPLAAHNLTFSIDDDSGKVVVKIIDGTTQDVIRQIPSEEALSIGRSLDQLKGLLLNGKA